MISSTEEGMPAMTSSKPTTWRKSSHSAANGDCVEVASWRKSSYSDANGECVEVGIGEHVIRVRDTTQYGAGPVLDFPATAWISFIVTV